MPKHYQKLTFVALNKAMLYPTTVDPVAQPPLYIHTVQPGCLIAFTVDLGPTDVIPLTVTQAAPAEDHSLRCWVATRVGGSPVIDRPYNQSFWHANRTPYETLVLYGDQTTNPGGNALKLPAGRYYLHVLNLANMLNAFTVTLPV